MFKYILFKQSLDSGKLQHYRHLFVLYETNLDLNHTFSIQIHVLLQTENLMYVKTVHCDNTFI